LKGLDEAIKNHTILDLKYRILRPNNEIRYVWSRAKAFYDADGKPVMLRGLLTDITEIKKAEIEREENINSLKEMLFMTSHKVRVPIANIQGIYHMLDNVTDPEKLKKSIGFIKKSVDALDTFTRELTVFMEQLKAEKELGTNTVSTV
jgi:signal transduction histidine kinase